ncbi:microtubule-associated protein RP/EB family member 1-like [Drosophila serrata]|uniref:microtubule-associated protein RP/EB family member 1-like n=1 Tax=Drosophila serrata TaxID=7274 RepID=UPI000A1D1905|nr:microtubule-associated protein RP/EB family member 1-like [Drosophila serrata]
MAHGGGDDLFHQLPDIVELKKERDYYFSKLRIIEALCHESEETEKLPFIQKILGILYSTDDGTLRQERYVRAREAALNVNENNRRN